MSKNEQHGSATAIEANALPSHEQLVSLIQFELDRAEKVAAKPGWTTWALWGALATVAWLVGGEIKGSTIAWDAVESWFLFGSMLTDLIVIVSGLLSHESNQQNQGHRFFITNRSFGSARSLLALLFLRYGTLTVLGINHFSLLSPWGAYPLVSYTVLASVLVAIILIYSFASFPLPSTQAPTRSKNIIFVFLILLAVIGTTSLLDTLSKNPNSLSLADIRVAGLLWTASMLSIMLTMARPKSPLTRSLIDIRRDLGLNTIDLSTAKRQIELAIHGLQVADILQQEISAVLTPLRLALNAAEQISRDLQALLAQLPTDPSSTLTSEQDNLTSAVLRSVKSLQDDVSKRVTEAEAASTLFARKAAFIIGTNPNTEAEIDTLRGEIISAVKDLKERTTATHASMDNLAMRVRVIDSDKQQGSSPSTPPYLSVAD